jgi:murein DD-endopeptidase MepM/ murein hydrolase activator NlpD
MSRAFFAFAAVSAALAACTLGPPPVADPAYEAARAPLHTSLQLCRNANAYNVGPVTVDRFAADYTPYIDTRAGLLLRNPTVESCISSGFGLRPDASGGGRNHLGLDLKGERGSFIYAAGAGRVSIIGEAGTYGNLVEVNHGRGVRTRYAHLSEFNPRLRRGTRVEAGTAIGRMGATGRATGVHLHYEVLVRRKQVNPLLYGPAAAPPVVEAAE